MTGERGLGPLSGLKMIEFAGLGPVPFCAMMLADLGAEVLRIDRPAAAGEAGWQFQLLNRGRRSVILDLKSPEGVAAALHLIARADAVIEGNRPGVMERLGLGPADCHAVNPALTYGRMTGWGQTGPLAQRAGHDISYLAPTGALWSIGRAGGAPVPPLNLVADLGGGAMFLAVGLLAAMFEARGSGKGQVVDAAMIDGVNTLLTWMHGYHAAGKWHWQRGANLLDSGCPWYDSYETADGGHVAIGPIEPQFYAILIDALGLDPARLPPRDDRARWPDLRATLAAAFARHDLAHWQQVLEPLDACAMPVLRPDQAADHPHMQARGSFASIAGIRQPVPAPRFSRSQPTLPTGPRPAGADTRQALTDWGMAPGVVDRLCRMHHAIQTAEEPR
nr:CaiB/BaiF CoA-transferase family protein [Gemmobacter sp.]